MKRLVFLPLVLAMCAGAAQAQYRESVTAPTTNYWFAPHDAPRTVTGSVGYPGGKATITFVSTPAPSVLAQAQGPERGYEVAAGQLDYSFSYRGPAMSYVPINFLGLFNLQVGVAFLDGAEIGVDLSSMALDRTRVEVAGMQLRCTRACGFDYGAPYATGLSSLQVSYVASTPAGILGSYGAGGSFSGTLMAATDANGQGQGSVRLRAQASASNSRLSGAFIDPMFTIDASYLASHPDATLTLPPGVGNAITAVPEPQTVALMLAGLAGLGAVVRRRRVA
jgi:hypothetical protein